MPRNLNRRVEVQFPVNKELLNLIRDAVRFVHLADNVQSRFLQADGTYVRLQPGPGEESLDTQAWMLEHFATRSEDGITVNLPYEAAPSAQPADGEA